MVSSTCLFFPPKSSPFPTSHLQFLNGFLLFFASPPPSPIPSSFPSPSPSPLLLLFRSPLPSPFPSCVHPRVSTPVPVPAPPPLPSLFPCCICSLASIPVPVPSPSPFTSPFPAPTPILSVPRTRSPPWYSARVQTTGLANGAFGCFSGARKRHPLSTEMTCAE